MREHQREREQGGGMSHKVPVLMPFFKIIIITFSNLFHCCCCSRRLDFYTLGDAESIKPLPPKTLNLVKRLP